MFQISDRSSLMVLCRALITAKFGDDDLAYIEELHSSPIMAELCMKAYDAQVEAARKDCNQALVNILVERRSAALHEDLLELVRKDIQKHNHSPVWKKWSVAERTRYVEIVLSPFVATPELIENLLNENS